MECLLCKCTYGISDELSGSARNGALLDNDGTLTGVLGNNSGDSLERGHVSGAAGTDTTVLGGGVDGDEDNVGLTNVLGDVGREEKVGLAGLKSNLVRGTVLVGDGRGTSAITSNADNVVQTGLVDGRVLRVPSADSGGV